MGSNGYTRRWRVVTVEQPAIGTDWSIRVPGNATWRIESMVARLVASAAVANRIPTLIADDQTSTWWTQIAAAAQTAGQTVDHVLATGIGHAYNVTGVMSYPALSRGMLLRPGNRLRAVTAGIDAGDQWSRITLLVDEIPSDTPYVGDGVSAVAMEM